MAVTSELMQKYLDGSLNGKVEDVLRSLENGVNINITDHLGRTALMLACIKPDNTKIINILLLNGINIFALDNEGNSALDYTQQNQNIEAEHFIRNKFRDQKSTEMFVKEANKDNTHTRQIQLETIINVCDELKSLEGKHRPFVYYKKTIALFELGHEEDGKKLLAITKQIFVNYFGSFEKANNWSKDETTLYKKIILKEAELIGDGQSKIWLFHEALELTKDPEVRYEYGEKKEEAYLNMVSTYTAHGLKVAYISEEISAFQTKSILSLKMSELGNLKFPEDKPKVNTYYAVHPFDHCVLFPLKNAPKNIFDDQLNELISILQALGATSIKVSSKGNETLEHTFIPSQKPHLPARLTWYNYRPAWQSIVKQRIEGALESTELTLDADQILDFSASELEQIQKEIIKLQGSTVKPSNVPIKSNQDLKEISNTKISCKLLISFEDPKKLIGEHVAPSIFKEDKVKVSQEAKKLQKSIDEKAKEKKENEQIKTLPKEEVKETIVESCNDLHTTNISSEDTKSEESKTGFSQEERYYYEMLQRAHQDGPISEEIRKVLERRRVRFNISRERSEEIENNMTQL